MQRRWGLVAHRIVHTVFPGSTPVVAPKERLDHREFFLLSLQMIMPLQLVVVVLLVLLVVLLVLLVLLLAGGGAAAAGAAAGAAGGAAGAGGDAGDAGGAVLETAATESMADLGQADLIWETRFLPIFHQQQPASLHRKLPLGGTKARCQQQSQYPYHPPHQNRGLRSSCLHSRDRH